MSADWWPRSLDITDSDFLAGTMVFLGEAGRPARCSTRARCRQPPAAPITLLAPDVLDQGLIEAKLGTVVLASGDAVDPCLWRPTAALSVKVDPATVKSQIAQGGAIVAADGRVLATAKVANALLGGAISLGGPSRPMRSLPRAARWCSRPAARSP